MYERKKYIGEISGDFVAIMNKGPGIDKTFDI